MVSPAPTDLPAPPFDRARAALTALTTTAPCAAARAPGRINVIGEHTDYNDGVVLPLALAQETVVLAAPGARDALRIVCADLDDAVISCPFGPDAPAPAPATTAAYVHGTLAAWFGADAIPPLDLAIASSIPIGAGLSSSAALTVATSLIASAVRDDPPLDVRVRAERCQAVEHDAAGTPCGVMDPFIVAGAVADHALLIDCRTVTAEPIPLPDAQRAALLVIDTGVRHEMATSEYAERRATCARAAAKLGVPALRDATPSMIEAGALTTTEARRATHVVLENTRVLMTAHALLHGDLDHAGDQMFASHASLRGLYAVSTPELDQIVEDAATLGTSHGIYGARMTGGGFGGCAIVLCHAAAAESVADALSWKFAAQFDRRPEVFRAHAAAGASRIDLR